MKKGCFIKLIILLTVFIAVIVYIIQHHLNDFVLKPGKKIISGMMVEEFDKKMLFVRNNQEKDSLKILLDLYIDKNINSFDDLNENKKFEDLFDTLKGYIKDSVIDRSEIIRFKNIIAEK